MTPQLAQGQANPMQQPGQPPGGFDIMQLMQMILASQQSSQQNVLNAATQPHSKIAQSPRNNSGGLDNWYNMNPHARQGEGYAQSRQAQVQGNQVFRQQEQLQQRVGLAQLLNQLASQQQQFEATGMPMGNVNPFFQ